MEQKERYELHESKKNFIEIFDNVRDRWITEDNICDRLNDYDKEMKELEAKVPTPFMKTLQENTWEVLREENRKLTEELDKYKETIQELQETSSKMFDRLLKNHLHKFQENPYNEENQEFKNDTKLLISVSEQIKDFKNSQNQVTIDVLHDIRNTLRFHTYNIRDDRFDYTRTMCLWTDINEIIDKQIKNIKGD